MIPVLVCIPFVAALGMAVYYLICGIIHRETDEPPYPPFSLN